MKFGVIRGNMATSRITTWQRKNRRHVRDELRRTVKDRVGRNAARRILERSSRKKACETCGTTSNLTVIHRDNNPKNNALPNLGWKCKKHHGSHEGRYPKKLSKV